MAASAARARASLDHSIGSPAGKLHTIAKLSAFSQGRMSWQHESSDLDGQPIGFDFGELVQFPLPAAGTNAARMFPVLHGFQIGVPKRPRSTLPGAGRIHAAPSRLPIEEDAVAIGK